MGGDGKVLAAELSLGAPSPTADLPMGEISRWLVDGSPCDLAESQVFTDGVWDLATVRAVVRDPVDRPARRRHDDEGDEIAAALRAAWPASTILFRRPT